VRGCGYELGEKAGAVGDGAAEVFGNGLAHVGESGAGAEVDAGAVRAGVREDRNVFAGVVGGFPAGIGIAAVVGGENEEIAAGEKWKEIGEGGVEFFEGAGKAFNVFAMAVEHVEVDEIAEDEAVGTFVKRGDEFVDAVGVGSGCDVVADAAAVVDVVDFADAEDGDALFGEDVEKHGFGRVDGVVVASRSTCEVAGSAVERAGDDATNAVGALQKFAGNFAHFVKVGDGDDTFMRGDLEDAVAGGVDDRLAGADVLFAKFLDDFGAGGGLVTNGVAADAFFKLSDDVGRKAVFVDGKSLIEPYAGHFPVAGSGVFAGGASGSFAEGAERFGFWSEMGERGDVGKTELDEMRQVERAGFGDVTESGPADVIVVGGVRQGADADAVQDDPDDAAERGHERECNTVGREWRSGYVN